MSGYPSLYQVNTRVLLTGLSVGLGRQATLDDIDDRELQRFEELGFDWIWLLSVWSTGEKGRDISLSNPQWRKEFQETIPDLKEEDIGGSGFAIADYTVSKDLGGEEALSRLRSRLKKLGIKLMLDFVPNHMGPDHPWVQSHPEYFVSGTEEDFQQKPQNYARVKLPEGERVLAYGRDPYFDGWPDTFQLDYSNPDTVQAMKQELLRIAGQCDGVRCDMAMLVLPDIFERTWGRKAQVFWPEIIKAVRSKHPGFCFMAEVYWDLEWEMQQQGFDYAYDKRLYDRLHEGLAKPVREHFCATPDYQNGLARFLENHDEPRVAKAFVPQRKHEAAAVLTFLSPGLRFFHQGQLEGKQIRISPHLIRGPHEQINQDIQSFYARLLKTLKNPVFRNGSWQLLSCRAAWDGDNTWDSFIAFYWEDESKDRSLVVVNYSPRASQCFVEIPFAPLDVHSIRFEDMLSSAVYDRDGSDLISRGLYLDLAPWGFHVFEMIKLA